MVTKQQALTENMFHVNREHSQRPGDTCFRWRRNGMTQTWKTRPDDFRVPVKYGLYDYDNITSVNAHLFHTESDCPYGS